MSPQVQSRLPLRTRLVTHTRLTMHSQLSRDAAARSVYTKSPFPKKPRTKRGYSVLSRLDIVVSRPFAITCSVIIPTSRFPRLMSEMCPRFMSRETAISVCVHPFLLRSFWIRFPKWTDLQRCLRANLGRVSRSRANSMTVPFGCRLTVFAAVVAVAASFCPAQNLPSQLTGNATNAVQKVSLATVSVVEIPSLPVESIATPVLCQSDGGVLLRLAMPGTGLEDPVSISEDGKTVVRFDRNKINDISRPTIRGLFPKGTDVYVLGMGSAPLGYEIRLRKPNGEVVSQPTSKTSSFVGRFRRDGSYTGSVPLELPFKALQFGVFDDGDFLVAGMDSSTSEPRVAIVALQPPIIRSVSSLTVLASYPASVTQACLMWLREN